MELTTPTAWPDGRSPGCKTQGRRLAFEARRQGRIRWMPDPTDDLRQRVFELDAPSVDVLAERDLPDIDYASGAGY